MERRKCIGVFIGQPNLPFQTELIKHIKNHAFAVGSNVVIFSSLIYTNAYEHFQDGESMNIALANFDTMDAVIVVPDTFFIERKEILEYVRSNFSGPKVVLDMEAEGYHPYFSDDKDSAAHMVSHLIEEHNCHDIAYMTGFKNHPHSIDRLNGYYMSLNEHNIPIDESRVFYGDFWYNCGEQVVEDLINSEKGLPQAIACANDAMAVSVYKALEERGYKIPEDILVTGFDHAGNANSGDYPITSVIRNAGEIAERAMRYIFKKWGLLEFPEIQREERLVINKSCGCQVENKEQYRITNSDAYESFYTNYNFMLEDLISTDDIYACISKIDWYSSNGVKYLNDYNDLHICLCEDWNTLSAKAHEGSFTDKIILAMKKQDQQPKPSDELEETNPGPDIIFDRKEYFPSFGSMEDDPKVYYFNVLHFGKNCFGYIIISYGPENKNHVFDDVYITWTRKISTALESLRRQYAVKELYKEAEERAIRDTMTGLYNRNGYNHILSDMINDIGPNEKFAFLFFDNNGLKYINDTYGHVAGDDVICQSAKIISKQFFPNARKEVNFRIGGDEYVKLVLGNISGETAGKCIDSIHEELDKINKQANREYPIYLAGGFQLYTAETILSPDDLMKSADEQMYVNKKILKESTGFNPIRKNK